MIRKQQRGEATVDQVLDAALRIYAASGESGLTVDAITKAGGVSSGSIYHHFGSLHGVVVALTQRWLGRLLEQLTNAITRSDDARSGVRAVIRAYLEFVQTHPDAARLLHSVTADREGMDRAEQIRDAQEARLSPIAEWINARTESGELAALPAPLIESLVMGPVVAVARRYVAVGDIDLDEAARELPDHIWQSVAGPAA
ncbi:TetR/AcrR family transcriptional regulator [Streptomyces boluensis]|uniref:TetR family transcriptional regulator n=1 Tax=Streptomyces boluensis TaxID=1775135 RepID=A0A964UNI7_9ACTN|nr:TetR/AcrR family transcriptional regulator [Streptomyces boluensis]NBE52529.1 TetR family transcriptional regulator [Streptomyces boluensis]